jgi:carbonic anhydrase
MTVIDTLTERNDVFARTDFAPGLPMMPRWKTLLIGCVDPRVDPAHVLGIALGEAGIIRNVGGRVTPATIGEVALLGRLSVAMGVTGPPGELIVLQHTDCGIKRLQDPPEQLAGYFQVDAAALADKHVADPWAAVQADVAILRSLPPIAERFQVTGLVYDVETGRVERVA